MSYSDSSFGLSIVASVVKGNGPYLFFHVAGTSDHIVWKKVHNLDSINTSDIKLIRFNDNNNLDFTKSLNWIQ